MLPDIRADMCALLYIPHVERREDNPKTSQKNLINFAGLHERAILPEATGGYGYRGRCKRRD